AVLAWIDAPDVKRPVAILRSAGASAACGQFSGVIALDPRNRGSIYMTAGSLLAAYRYPEVDASSARGFTAPGFLDGDANTLYVVASSRQQRILAPLVVAMLSSVLHAAAEPATRTSPLVPTLRARVAEA